MTYIALLRGINVGGKNKVAMQELKRVFENCGTENVRTYINSGNVIFSSDDTSKEALAAKLEQAIKSTFGFAVKVLVMSQAQLKTIVAALPDSWVNDATMKCDVMFLWDSHNSKEVLRQLTIKPDLDDVKYVAGAILWRVDKANATRSGLGKLVGSELYQHMTIRNSNTARKLLELTQ